MEHDIPVGKAEEGAEAVARHGGTLEFIAECLKGREMEDDRQKGGKKIKSLRESRKKKKQKICGEVNSYYDG